MDKYELLGIVGQGTFGTVYKARCKSDGQTYCLKRILAMPGGDGNSGALMEAKLLSSLDHPNIVKYKESFLDPSDGALVIVTAYCAGGDLSAAISRRAAAAGGPSYFTEDEVMDLFLQIAGALHYIHSRRILHRDLKPANVLLTARGVPCLADFGISKVQQSEGDAARSIVGTPVYLSPEVCRGQPYTFKSDIWALGCVLFEMATLRHAFAADSLLALVWQIVQGEVPELPAGRYSEDFAALIQALLERDAARRPSLQEVFGLPYVRHHVQRFNAQERRRAMARHASLRSALRSSSSITGSLCAVGSCGEGGGGGREDLDTQLSASFAHHLRLSRSRSRPQHQQQHTLAAAAAAAAAAAGSNLGWAGGLAASRRVEPGEAEPLGSQEASSSSRSAADGGGNRVSSHMFRRHHASRSGLRTSGAGGMLHRLAVSAAAPLRQLAVASSEAAGASGSSWAERSEAPLRASQAVARRYDDCSEDEQEDLDWGALSARSGSGGSRSGAGPAAQSGGKASLLRSRPAGELGSLAAAERGGASGWQPKALVSPFARFQPKLDAEAPCDTREESRQQREQQQESQKQQEKKEEEQQTQPQAPGAHPCIRLPWSPAPGAAPATECSSSGGSGTPSSPFRFGLSTEERSMLLPRPASSPGVSFGGAGGAEGFSIAPSPLSFPGVADADTAGLPFPGDRLVFGLRTDSSPDCVFEISAAGISGGGCDDDALLPEAFSDDMPGCTPACERSETPEGVAVPGANTRRSGRSAFMQRGGGSPGASSADAGSGRSVSSFLRLIQRNYSSGALSHSQLGSARSLGGGSINNSPRQVLLPSFGSGGVVFGGPLAGDRRDSGSLLPSAGSSGDVSAAAAASSEGEAPGAAADAEALKQARAELRQRLRIIKSVSDLSRSSLSSGSVPGALAPAIVAAGAP